MNCSILLYQINPKYYSTCNQYKKLRYFTCFFFTLFLKSYVYFILKHISVWTSHISEYWQHSYIGKTYFLENWKHFDTGMGQSKLIEGGMNVFTAERKSKSKQTTDNWCGEQDERTQMDWLVWKRGLSHLSLWQV